MINGVSDITRANQYSAKQRDKAAASFGQQLSEAAKQRMQTASAYETGIHTGPQVAGTEVPASREGVAVDTIQYADGLLTVSRLTAPPVAPAAEAAPVQDPKDIENDKTYYVEGGPTLIEQFGQFLLENAAKPDHHAIIGPKEDTVCSQGHGIGGDQVVYAEYTADSTPEEPIVRILCQSHSGLYEFIRHINDIDPSNCTYAELAALYGHLRKTGQDYPLYDGLGAVPSGYEIGDMMQRQNFVAGLEDLSQSKMFGPGILQDAAALSKLYSIIAEEKKAMEAEDAEFEALLAAVDNVIENKPVLEPKEILERLSEPARDTLEDIKADKEVSQEEWKGLLEELRDMGAISDTEFTYSRSDFRFIPIGYRDENGELVMYDGIAERFGMLDKLRSTSGGGIGMLTDAADFWAGDPLAYLDAWIADLAGWREDLSKQRSGTGVPKYNNFSPIDDQIDACTKVSEIVNGLLEQFA